jgi:hypothetical protein
MAKALYGHVGGADPRLLAEVARLRRRVEDLEKELARTRAEIDLSRSDILSLDEVAPEPALA